MKTSEGSGASELLTFYCYRRRDGVVLERPACHRLSNTVGYLRVGLPKLEWWITAPVNEIAPVFGHGGDLRLQSVVTMLRNQKTTGKITGCRT